MNYRQLGNSGVRVSVIGLGANRFGSENVPQTEVNRMIDAALDLGINFIDTSKKRPSATRSRDAAIKSSLQPSFHSPKRTGPIPGARRVIK